MNQEILNDIPEVILIEGNFGSGKTALAVEFLDRIITSKEENVYSNVSLILDNFNNKFNFIKLDRINYATFLNIKKGSCFLNDEIHKSFDKRDFAKNKKNTQSIQEIRKFGYKLIGTSHRANMLDFRLLRTSTYIIRAYGNLEQIIKYEWYNKINPEILQNFTDSLTKENKDFIFLYQWAKYNEEESEGNDKCMIDYFNNYFTFDIRGVFNKYNTHEKIQKMTFLNNFTN